MADLPEWRCAGGAASTTPVPSYARFFFGVNEVVSLPSLQGRRPVDTPEHPCDGPFPTD